MSTRPLVVDGLWRALCPTFSPHLLQNSAQCQRSILRPTKSHCQSTLAGNGSIREHESSSAIEKRPEKKVWGKLRTKTNTVEPQGRHNEHSKALHVPGLGTWPPEQSKQRTEPVEHGGMQETEPGDQLEEVEDTRMVRTKGWGQLRRRSDNTSTSKVDNSALHSSKSGEVEKTRAGQVSREDVNASQHDDRFGRAQRRVERLLSGDEAEALRIPTHLRTRVQAAVVAQLNRDRIVHKKSAMEAELGRYVTWDEARAAIPRSSKDSSHIHEATKSTTEHRSELGGGEKTPAPRTPRLRGTSPWLSNYIPGIEHSGEKTLEDVDQGKLLQQEGFDGHDKEDHVQKEQVTTRGRQTIQSISLEDENFIRKAGRAELYERLPQAAEQGQLELVECLVFKLVHDLHESPSSTLYGCLILANVSHTSGSAARARALVEELKADGLRPDAQIYNALLQVLAVHPDVIYRSQILAEMHEQWIDLASSSQNYIAAGHIKDLQVEQALEVLDAMLAKSVEPEPWLLDMLIYQLCALGEIDEAFRMLRQRVNGGTASRNAISPVVWLTLFDCAATALHYPAIAYIWRRRVELLKFTPSTGQCTAVLHCAARHADIPLATDVFRALSTRGTTFGIEHYELLVDCYTRAHDIDTALHILCIMQTAGVAPNERSTRPLSRALLATPSLITPAFETLKDLRDQGRAIPLAAVNCVIEATLDAAEAQDGSVVAEGDTNAPPPLGLAAAIEQYKHVHHLCPSGPSAATFDALLRGCRIARRKDTAMFLAAEMVALGLQPGALTYDRLILVCLQSADVTSPASSPEAEDEFGLGVGLGGVQPSSGSGLEDAKRYYGEMRSQGFWPRRGTFRQLVERCAREGDDTAWWLVDEMNAAGYDERPTREWLDENWSGP